MKLYLITAITGDKADIVSQYAGSQADVAAQRKKLRLLGFKNADIVVSEIDVLTDKVGLIAFLNR